MSKTTRSALRIFSETDEVDELNNLLGLRATRWRPKTSNVARINERRTGERRSIWSWEPEIEPLASPAEHVSGLVSVLEEHQDALSTIASRGDQLDIVLSYASDNGQGGMTFRPDLLERMTRLGLGISIDLFLVEDESNAQSH